MQILFSILFLLNPEISGIKNLKFLDLESQIINREYANTIFYYVLIESRNLGDKKFENPQSRILDPQKAILTPRRGLLGPRWALLSLARYTIHDCTVTIFKLNFISMTAQ